MNKILALTLVAATLTSSCAHRIGDFTVASTKNMDVKGSLHTVDQNRRVVGKDIMHVILGMPVTSINMKEAMDNAIEKTPSAVGLSDVTVKQGAWTAILYGQTYYEIEGNPVYEVETK